MTDRPILDQIEAYDPDATLARHPFGWELRMSRFLPHPAERVWPMLVEPEQLGRWSPIVPDRPLDHVGPATSRETPDADPVPSQVLLADAPHELIHHWGDAVLRWTLRDEPGGTRLTLHQTFADRSFASSMAAGWHVCLATLLALDGGHDVERAVGDRALDYGWPALKRRYDTVLDAGQRLREPPVMRAQLAFRVPVAQVFAAFTDPVVTTRFWFDRSSGPLAPGAAVTWTWSSHGHSADVVVTQFEPGERILMTWGPAGGGARTEVEWRFSAVADDVTRVEVAETGFAGDGDEMVRAVVDSTGGFSTVLVAAKALLEFDVRLDVISNAEALAAH